MIPGTGPMGDRSESAESPPAQKLSDLIRVAAIVARGAAVEPLAPGCCERLRLRGLTVKTPPDQADEKTDSARSYFPVQRKAWTALRIPSHIGTRGDGDTGGRTPPG